MVWEDIAALSVDGRRIKFAVNGRNRIIAFTEDSDGVVLSTVEVFLSLNDLAAKHREWLKKFVLLSDNERVLAEYENLLQNATQQ